MSFHFNHRKSEHLIDTARAKTEQCKNESDYRIKERLQDIQYSLDEISKQKQSTCLEEDALKTYCQRLVNASAFVDELGKKNERQLDILKEETDGIHITNANVDKELKKENEIIESSQDVLKRALAQAFEQMRMLRSVNHSLDRELSNKGTSLHIDQTNLALNSNQRQLQYIEGFSVKP